MKFKTRILLLPGVTLVIFAAGWLAGSVIAARTADSVAALGNVDYPYIEGVSELNAQTKRTTDTIQSAVAEGDPGKIDDAKAIGTEAAATLKRLAAIQGHEGSVKALGAAYVDYATRAGAAATAMLDSADDAGTKVSAMQEAQKAVTALLEREMGVARQGVESRLEASRLGVRHMVIANSVSGIAIVLVLVLGAWFMLRAIARDLGADPEQLRGLVGRIARGDLTYRKQDDISADSVLGRLQAMARQLAEIVGSIREVAQSVGDASAQISEGNDDLSRRSQDQAAALEETAASMEQMNSSVKQNAENAGQVDRLARAAREAAQQGGRVVAEANDAMQAIDASSRRIADIVGLIDEIAFQTNLLSLNAAVEAARAGEQGRGFAVVASEVRALAQRSAGAAKEIKGLIADSVAKVDTGSKLVAHSGETLSNIITSVRKVSDSVAEIVAASQEQATGIDEVNRTVAAMDEGTQHNAALVEEVSATSRAMHEQAETLMQKVAFFRLEDEFAAAAPAPIAQETVHVPGTELAS